jgi:hypothetical protein
LVHSSQLVSLLGLKYIQATLRQKMSNAVYEKIGRRVVELLAHNAQFAKAPNKGIGGEKNKCKPTSQSCGFSCISGKKVCRIAMTLEQQQAAKQLKKELRASTAGSQEAAKPKLDPAFDVNAGIIAKIEARGDRQSAGDKAHIAALEVPQDPHNDSALDRVAELKRHRDRLEKSGDLSDDNLRDVAHAFGQGMRGGANSAANLATAEYTAEIHSKLSPESQNKLAGHFSDYTKGKPIRDHFSKTNGFDQGTKSPEVQQFLDAIEGKIKL